MIKIYNKTKDEIREEEGLYKFAAALVDGIPFKVCSTYVIVKGERVDTKDIAEPEIVSLILNDLEDWHSNDGSYSIKPRSLDSFLFIEALRGYYKPSYSAVYQIGMMEDRYGSIVRDVLGALDKNDTINKATLISNYLKQCNGDFSPSSKDEVFSVIKQMDINVHNKNKAK